MDQKFCVQLNELLVTTYRAIHVLLIHFFFGKAQPLTEALEMNDLSGAQEFDHVIDIGIVRQPQNVVIGNAGFLLRCQILREIGDDIALYGHGGRVPRKSGGGRGVNAGGVVYEIRIKAGGLDVLFREISGELVDDGSDHLQMTQFLSADKGSKMANAHSIA